MLRWQKILAALAICASYAFVPSWTLVAQSVAQTAESLDREVRSALPMGSSLAAVQDYLTKRGLEFSFEERSKTMFAIARNLPGSTFLISKSVAFKFYFGDGLTLESIDSRVEYTGP